MSRSAPTSARRWRRSPTATSPNTVRPALSVAVAQHGRLAYAQGFGLADPATGAKVTPANLFRIASVSKPVTSVTVFSLVEQGRLKLTDMVFGRAGILGNDYGAPKDQRILEITVEHLLTHTCGGWPNKGRDPMFLNLQMDQRRLIAWTLANVPLDHPPGTAYAYSNFGYCLLGRVIEKLTRQPYGAYVRQSVLARCGVTQMRIGFGPANARAPDEVAYVAQGGDPYRVKVARADSCGGWIATPLRSRALRHACRRPRGYAEHSAAGNHQGHDDAVGAQSQVRQGLDRQRPGLVAQRQPAGHVGRDGARAERFVLGRPRQYAAARSAKRRRPQPCGRADGARGEELEYLTHRNA